MLRKSAKEKQNIQIKRQLSGTIPGAAVFYALVCRKATSGRFSVLHDGDQGFCFASVGTKRKFPVSFGDKKSYIRKEDFEQIRLPCIFW